MDYNHTYHSILNHPFVILGIYIILSNAVNALVPPTVDSGNFYRWFFTFSHGILVQAGRFMSKGTNGNGVVSNAIVDNTTTAYGQMPGNLPAKQWEPFKKGDK